MSKYVAAPTQPRGRWAPGATRYLRARDYRLGIQNPPKLVGAARLCHTRLMPPAGEPCSTDAPLTGYPSCRFWQPVVGRPVEIAMGDVGGRFGGGEPDEIVRNAPVSRCCSPGPADGFQESPDRQDRKQRRE